jgi:hypothetical protein
MMIQWDKSLCDELDEIYELKSAKEKKRDQLTAEIHKDTIKFVFILTFIFIF